MAVCNFGFAEESIEGLHGLMIPLWFRLAGSPVHAMKNVGIRGGIEEIKAIARGCAGELVFEARGGL
jgi:hypothetical protein